MMTHIENEIARIGSLAVQAASPRLAEAIGDAIGRVPGVANVRTEEPGIFTIEYDPASVSPGQFLNLARQVGCEASWRGRDE